MNKHLPISNDIKRIIGKYNLPLKVKFKPDAIEISTIKNYLDTDTIRYNIGGILYKCFDFNETKYKYEKGFGYWTLRPKSTVILESVY
jgi:hypothetical protein